MNSINGIQTHGKPPEIQPAKTPLSEEKKAQALEIIAQYDAENMSDEDKKAMRTELHEAGIGRSRELKEILEDKGFEVKKEGPPQGPPPPPPENNLEIKDFLAKYESGEFTSQDIDQLMQFLKTSGQSSSGVVVDETA